MVEIQESKSKAFKNPKQKKQTRLAFILLAIIIIATVSIVFFLSPKEKTYSLSDYDTARIVSSDFISTTQASGAVIIPQQMTTNCPEEGYAYQLFVDEGSVVTTGDVLAVITAPDLEEEMEDLLESMETKKRTLELFIVQHQFELTRSAYTNEDLENQIQDAEKELETKTQLALVNNARQSEVETAQDKIEELLWTKKENILSQEETEAVYNLNLANDQAEIEQLQTNIDRLKQDQENLIIKSSMDGEIIDVESSLGVPGAFIAENTSLFTIAEPTSAVIELDVNEEYSTYLSLGQTVPLTIGSGSLNGTITKIGRVAVTSSDGLNSTITVTVTPETITSSIISGATAVGEFLLESRENVLILERGPYLTTGNQKYLYRINQDGTASRINVTYGEIQGTQVEILSGVEAGDEIIVSGYQNFINYEEIKLN